ncbi:MAG: hypothetical protein Q8Q09_07850 [Deltaproteobacteria bacterium]|nr:hypothetical protein [Deltaproteobacteria bacterium]
MRVRLCAVRAVLVLAVLGSIVGLALGALVHAMARGRWRAAVEGLVLGAVPLLLVVRLVPHLFEALGRNALVLMGVGFAALVLADRSAHNGGVRMGRVMLVPALMVHALADGIALALAAAEDSPHREHRTPEPHDDHEAHEHGHGSVITQQNRWVLVLAIIAHRLPEGLLICAALVPLLGWPRALKRLSFVGMATVVGAIAGRSLLRVAPEAWLDGLVALGVGAMLRLSLHSHTPAPKSARERGESSLAFLLGVAIVLVIPDADGVWLRAQPTELSVAHSLLPFFVESAPAMALALLLLVSSQSAVTPKHPLVQRLLGALPFVSPTSHSTRTGESLALDALLLSLGWLGAPLALLRWALVWPLEAIWALTPKPSSDHAHAPVARTVAQQLAAKAAWYCVGLVGAAVCEAALASRSLEWLRGPRAVVLAVGMGVLVPVPLVAAVACGAVLLHKGVALEVLLAWLWCVGLTRGSTRAQWLYRARNFPVDSLVRALLTAVVLALGVWAARSVGSLAVPALHPRLAHAHTPFEWACVAVAVAMIGGGLLHLGPRAVLEAMSSRDHSHDHGHSHEPAPVVPTETA